MSIRSSSPFSVQVVAQSTLQAAVDPLGFARDINLQRIDQTVHITGNDQVQEFLSAAAIPWTRILVDDGVTLAVRTTLRPAEGVKIYCPNGRFTIDGRDRDTFNVMVLESSHIYLANFLLQVPIGDTTVSNNPYVGIAIAKASADLIYLQSFTVDSPGNQGNQDAAETFHIWNMVSASGRVTLDRYELVTNPSPGCKGLLIGGPVDCSRVQVTMAHGICRSFQRGPLVGASAFVDFFNNIVPTVERNTAVHAREGAGIRVRASFFHPRTNTSWGSDLRADDAGTSVTLGPEPNVAHPGVTLQSYGPTALTPPYPTPPIWDEATVLARAGAGTIVLPG